MIAALLVAMLGLALAALLPAPACLSALITVPAALWLMSGRAHRRLNRSRGAR